MPQRLIKPVLAYLTPSEPPSTAFMFLQIAASAALAWIGAAPVAEKVFWVAAFVDLVTGMYACTKNDGKYDWHVGKDGIIRKVVLCIVVRSIWIVCEWLGGQQLATLMSYAFAFNEANSIKNNLTRGKFEVPEFADMILTRARLQFESRASVVNPPSPKEDEKKEG